MNNKKNFFSTIAALSLAFSCSAFLHPKDNKNDKDFSISIPSLSSILTGDSSKGIALQPLCSIQRSSSMHTISWSPDEKYLVTGAYHTPSTDLDLFYFDGTTITTTLTKTLGKAIHSVAWHPTLNYIAVGTVVANLEANRKELAILQFTPSRGTLSSKDLKTSISGSIYTVAWHPSGNYLFTGSAGSPQLAVYAFNTKSGTLTLLSNIALDSDPYLNSIRCSPDGKLIVIGTSQATFIYEFNGTSLSLKTSMLNGFSSSIDWSSNNDFIATSLFTSNKLQIYQYDRLTTKLAQQKNASPTENDNLFSLRWHPSLNYLATGSYSGDPAIKLYTLNTTTGAVTQTQTITNPSHIFALQWSPLGNYLASVSLTQKITIYKTIQQDAANLLDVTLGRNAYPLNTIDTVLYPYP